ncbi:hypothetical protein GCM10023350_01680 [Nocardioides endophyticus]|uniref:Uncharacterized protein n=1 Tax=Nocardioides endophyticus TaxID=1353775 RepID=A0ABP8Y7L3_9ACTN
MAAGPVVRQRAFAVSSRSAPVRRLAQALTVESERDDANAVAPEATGARAATAMPTERAREIGMPEG